MDDDEQSRLKFVDEVSLVVATMLTLISVH